MGQFIWAQKRRRRTNKWRWKVPEMQSSTDTQYVPNILFALILLLQIVFIFESDFYFEKFVIFRKLQVAHVLARTWSQTKLNHHIFLRWEPAKNIGCLLFLSYLDALCVCIFLFASFFFFSVANAINHVPVSCAINSTWRENLNPVNFV